MQLSDYIKPISGLQFFLPVIDYGKEGIEGIGSPEMTRSDIVAKVRDIFADPRGRTLVCVKHIDGNDMTDVTDEIVQAATAEPFEAAVIDIQAARFDHARDLRKLEVM